MSLSAIIEWLNNHRGVLTAIGIVFGAISAIFGVLRYLKVQKEKESGIHQRGTNNQAVSGDNNTQIQVNNYGISLSEHESRIEKLTEKYEQKLLAEGKTKEEAQKAAAEYKKRYEDTYAELNRYRGNDLPEIRKALDEGNLALAEDLLRKGIATEDNVLKTAAQRHYLLGNTLSLQQKWDEVAKEYQRASEIAPDGQDKARYVFALAHFLQQQNQHSAAQQKYEIALKTYRELAKTNPAAYLPYVAGTLNNLANLYSDTQRMDEAQAAYDEALKIRRELAKTNPAAYLPKLLNTLKGATQFYRATNQIAKAQTLEQEAQKWLDSHR